MISSARNVLSQSEMIDAIEESYKHYLVSPRSPNKLKPLHGKIARDVSEQLGTNYTVMSHGHGGGKEFAIPTMIGNKNTDIVVLDSSETPVCVVQVKFICSNYSQNANNYLENMIGDTAFLRTKLIGLPVFHVVVIPEYMPYFKKDGEIFRIEFINDYKIAKYTNVFKEIESGNPSDGTPSGIYFQVINTNNKAAFEKLKSSGTPDARESIRSSNDYSLTEFDLKNTSLVTDIANRDFLKKCGNYDSFIQDIVGSI